MGKDGGGCGVERFKPGINIVSHLAAIFCHQICCHTESATQTWQRFRAERVGRPNVLPARLLDTVANL